MPLSSSGGKKPRTNKSFVEPKSNRRRQRSFGVEQKHVEIEAHRRGRSMSDKIISPAQGERFFGAGIDDPNRRAAVQKVVDALADDLGARALRQQRRFVRRVAKSKGNRSRRSPAVPTMLGASRACRQMLVRAVDRNWPSTVNCCGNSRRLGARDLVSGNASAASIRSASCGSRFLQVAVLQPPRRIRFKSAVCRRASSTIKSSRSTRRTGESGARPLPR